MLLMSTLICNVSHYSRGAFCKALRVLCERSPTCSEERLEVVRQLGAAGVARVHRDKHGAGRVEPDLRPLEQQRVRPGVDACNKAACQRQGRTAIYTDRKHANSFILLACGVNTPPALLTFVLSTAK